MATYNEVAIGGSVGACRVTANFIYRITGTSSDPASLGGLSRQTSLWNIVPTGGLIGSKTAYYSVVRTFISVGGSVAGGGSTHIVTKTVIARGGSLGGGLGIRTDPVNHYPNLPDYNPLIEIGGNSLARVGRKTTSTGGLSIAGQSLNKIDIAYSSVGQIEIGGSAGTRHKITIDLDIPWRVRGRISFDTQFVWDTGRLRQYYYRITGKQRQNVCPPVKAEECCSFFIANVHARTIEDLCQKLKDKNFVWPIEKVERFSRPAERSAIEEDLENGISYECNELEEVEICSIPICQEFCIDADAVVVVGATCQALFVNGEFTAEVNSGLEEGENSFTIGGTAEASFTENLYSESYISGDDIPENRSIGIGGSADVNASAYFYTGSGGLSLGGTPEIVSSAWDFIAGDWPFESDSRPPVSAEIYENDFSLISPFDATLSNSWFSINDALSDDSSYAVANVSWLASSNFLVLKNFKFEIPEEDTVIGLIQIDIKKYALNSLKDAEIYLIKGTEILSPNLAQDWTWNLSESVVSYYVIADNYTATVPGTPQKVGGWNVEDINDQEFGVAIRVLGQNNTSSVRAFINSVEIKIYYESIIAQTLKLGGESEIKSSVWHYTTTGGFAINGDASIGGLGYTVSPSGGVKLGGNYELNYVYEGVGGINLDGEALVQPIRASGGATIGGEIVISASNTVYEASGGLSLTYGLGTAETHVEYILETSGGFGIAGGSTSLVNLSYEAEGGLTTSGTSELVSSVWHYETEGALTLGGSSDIEASNFELFLEQNFDMTVFDIEYIYGSDVETKNTLSPSVDMVTACGCVDIPVSLRLSHNLVNRNRLSQFLARNSLTLKSEVKLNYNKVNDLWQGNLHYKGLSADLDTYETWDLLFEIKCTTFVGGTEIDKEVLSFSCDIKQKNLTNLDDYETRIIIGFLPDSACFSGVFNVKMNYDTQLDIVDVDPEAVIYYYRIYDDLDLFKNVYWSANPDLKFQISGNNLATNQYRKNMNMIFSKEQAPRKPAGPLLIDG
jgi:hypothetical protein